MFVIGLWIYIATGSELKLGTYGLISSSVAFVSYYIVGRFIKPKQRKKAVFIAGLILYLSVYIVLIGELTFTKLNVCPFEAL